MGGIFGKKIKPPTPTAPPPVPKVTEEGVAKLKKTIPALRYQL